MATSASDALDLFSNSAAKDVYTPLADRIRPASVAQLVGHEKYSKKIYMNDLQSMILWGPPGCGKTSLAKIIARNCDIKFYELSGVSCGTTEFKSTFNEAKQNGKLLLIIDEVHHLNKSQQDLFLPYLENGSLLLIGTTTENPSFELRPALLSRCKIIELKRLQIDDLKLLLERAEVYMKRTLPLTAKAREKLCQIADGDGRYLINRAEELFALSINTILDEHEMLELLPKRAIIYDKSRDEHYNLISALHKSMRGSDVNAALYWFTRMLEGGENIAYITRRLIRFAVEDIGMSDPNALLQALAARDAYDLLGSPEGELAVAQAVIYLSTAPKSNSIEVAYIKSRQCAKEFGSLMPDKKILNAPTTMMKNADYGKGYVYDHDTKNAFAGTDFFPDGLPRQEFYAPSERGFEKEIKKRKLWWDSHRKNKQ